MIKRRYSKTSKTGKNKRYLLIVGLVIVVGLAVGSFWLYQKDDGTTITTKDGNEVKLKPATNEEKKQAEDNKEEIVKNDSKIKQQEQAGTDRAQNTSSITITNASSTGVRAHVSGIFEEGGTCTATATKSGGQVIQKSSVGFQNVSYTQCAPIDWDTPLTAGTWTIKVSYSSTSTNSSNSTTIEVK